MLYPTIDPNTCRRNLLRSAELLTLCCTLQEAYLHTRFPHLSADELRRRVRENIVAAKERAWIKAQRNPDEYPISNKELPMTNERI